VDIRSTPSGYSPKTQTGRARESAPNAAARPGSAPAGSPDEAPVDRVELSSAARELSARLDDASAAGGLSPERMREIAGRMRSGHYDQAATVDRILEGVRSELTRGDSRE
jgi:hypothetical protein